MMDPDFMPPKRRLDVDDLETRAAKRRKVGPLDNNRVAGKVRERYMMHVSWFNDWVNYVGLRAAMTYEELDLQAAEYVEFLWDANQSLEIGLNTASGIQHVLYQRRALKKTWALLDVWRKHEPPVQAPPIDRSWLFAMAMYAITVLGEVAFGISLLTAFHGLLRTGELFGLQRQHVVFDMTKSSVLLWLGQSKSGKRSNSNEWAIVDEPYTVQLLMWLSTNLHPGDPMIGMSPHRWRKLFDESLEALQISSFGIRPYSLRRGGATALLRQCGDISIVMERGRWGSVKVCKQYLMEAVVILHQLTVPEGTAQVLANLAAMWAW